MPSSSTATCSRSASKTTEGRVNPQPDSSRPLITDSQVSTDVGIGASGRARCHRGRGPRERIPPSPPSGIVATDGTFRLMFGPSSGSDPVASLSDQIRSDQRAFATACVQRRRIGQLNSNVLASCCESGGLRILGGSRSERRCYPRSLTTRERKAAARPLRKREDEMSIALPKPSWPPFPAENRNGRKPCHPQ